MEDISKDIFPEGSTIHSSHSLQNGTFRTCGEIDMTSLAQGGPSPKFLHACGYEAMIKEVDCQRHDYQGHFESSQSRVVIAEGEICYPYSNINYDNQDVTKIAKYHCSRRGKKVLKN